MHLGKLFDKEFRRSFAVMFSGTAASQLIPILIMPILTRIYSPEQFGTLALFISLISILCVIATGRYELAVMLPESNQESFSLVALCSAIAFVGSLILLSIAIVFGDWLAQALGNASIRDWLPFIPVVVLFAGIQQALSYWSLRKKDFSGVARSKIIQSGATGGIQFSAFHLLPSIGLIVGAIGGRLVSMLYMVKRSGFPANCRSQETSVSEVITVAKKYSKFPRYSTVGALFDTSAAQLPILFSTRYFGPDLTGVFSLTFRVLTLPTSFFTRALSQILFQRIVEVDRQRPDELMRQIFLMFIFLLCLVSPLPIIMWFYGEPLFALVFGEEWVFAGEISRYLAFAVAMRFCVSPLSGVMSLDRNVGTGSVWQISYFLSILLILVIYRNYDFLEMIIAFVIVDILMNLVYLMIIIRGTRLVSKP